MFINEDISTAHKKIKTAKYRIAKVTLESDDSSLTSTYYHFLLNKEKARKTEV